MKKWLARILCGLFLFGSLFSLTGCKKETNPPGEIYSLEKAYENGWITREHLLSIAYYFGQTDNNAELQDENYAPIPKNPEKLSKKTALKIRKTELYSARSSKAELSDVEIIGYYGCYSGYYAVEISASYLLYPAVVNAERTIGGVLFVYTNEFPVLWKEN